MRKNVTEGPVLLFNKMPASNDDFVNLHLSF